MKIYIESIILLNFLLDYIILYGTKRLLKINTTNKRILLSSLLGSFTVLFLFMRISNYKLIIIKIILSILMNIIAFKKNNLLINTFYFYLISIIIGGTFSLIQKNTSFYQNMVLLLFVTPMIIIILIKEIQKEKLKLQTKYQVIIELNHKKYQLEGFIDTGNNLKDPITKKNVIIVNIKIPLSKVIWIPYKALNTEGIIPCMKPDKVEINKIEIKNCLIGLSKEKLPLKEYNCILPNKLREELC